MAAGEQGGIEVIAVQPVTIGSYTCISIEVELPKTRLVVVRAPIGYIMCGALDVHLLNTALLDRAIIAGRAVGVRTTEQLLAAPLESVTVAAQELGIQVGMSGRDALLLMCDRLTISRPEHADK